MKVKNMRNKFTVQFDRPSKKWVVVHSTDGHEVVARNLNKKQAIHVAVTLSDKAVPVVVTKIDGRGDYILFQEKGK